MSPGDRARAAPAGNRPKNPRAERRRPKHEPVRLSDEIIGELHSTARPGKGPFLVQAFAEAAAAFAAGDYTEAVRLADQAKHMALRSVVVRELLGLAHYRGGDYKAAAAELSAFRRLSGTTEQNPVLADCYRALGKPERALELCDEIERGPAAEAVRYEGAIVASGALADSGRLDEAIARLEALDLAPSKTREHHLRAWYALADLLERRGRFTQARGWFEALAAADAELTDASERARGLGHSG